MSEPKTKVCKECGKRKRASQFHKRIRTDRKDMLAPRCKPCALERERQRRAENRKLREMVRSGEILPPVNFVPAGPFRKWLEATIPEYESLAAFCAQCEQEERRIYDVLRGKTKRVSVDGVDRALSRDGRMMLWELYPKLYP